MQRLMNLRKNSKKGFTLIELIVVIVIIAILVAALTPAILGVIQRANRSADEADARTLMTVASVASTSRTPPNSVGLARIDFYNAFGLGDNTNTGLAAGTYVISYNGAFAYHVQLTGGRLNTVTGGTVPLVQVGNNTGITATTTVTITISAAGLLSVGP